MSTAARGELLAAVSNEIVQLHKRCYGKGPTQARSYFMDDLLVTLLRGGFTEVERTLRSRGRKRAVVGQRAEFQNAVADQFVERIEQITGRRVISFMSNTDPDAEVVAEIFVLEPEEQEKAAVGAEAGAPRRRIRAVPEPEPSGEA
jgi:uncharacterized protein YbcI